MRFLQLYLQNKTEKQKLWLINHKQWLTLKWTIQFITLNLLPLLRVSIFVVSTLKKNVIFWGWLLTLIFSVYWWPVVSLYKINFHRLLKNANLIFGWFIARRSLPFKQSFMLTWLTDKCHFRKFYSWQNFSHLEHDIFSYQSVNSHTHDIQRGENQAKTGLW